jgi:hypothetical protein
MSRKEYNQLKEEMKRSRINKRREIVASRSMKKIILLDQSNMRVRNNQVERCVCYGVKCEADRKLKKM